MRRLLNTLFVLSENGYLTVDGENVVVSRGKQEIGRIPMHTIESIRSFSYAGASPALMGACATRGIDVCFFSPRGRFLARAMLVLLLLSRSMHSSRMAVPNSR